MRSRLANERLSIFLSRREGLQPQPDRRPLLLVLALITAVTALRVIYLTQHPPLELAADEAHYWDWSRHLDWSYYSKGPLVAWLIRLSCALLGADTMLAVRLPAVLLSAGTLLGIYQLSKRTLGRPWLALISVLLVAAYPVFNVGALLMTIDAPYLFAWTWAVVLGHYLICESETTGQTVDSAWAGNKLIGWAVLGLIVGVGTLAKYTMILFFPALVIYGLVVREQRIWFWRPGPYLAGGVTALCTLPIVIWNARNGWVTLRHVGGQAGLAAGEFSAQSAGVNWLGPVEFLAGQFALLLGFGFIVWALSVIRAVFYAKEAGTPAPVSARFLATMSLVPFATFFAFSLKTKVQLNWPLAAYVPAVPLMTWWLAQRWPIWPTWKRRTLVTGVGFCVVLSLLMLHTQLLYPLMNNWREALPARKWDPTCRLRGWSDLAAAVAAKRNELREQGIEPVICATMWNQPGAVAFYLPDQPRVYCFGQLAGDRQSQYDFWSPHPAHQPEAFAGRTFLIVGWAPEHLWKHFERTEKPLVVSHEVGGQVVATWAVTIAHGFKVN